jgi:hypothetical protein
MDRGRYATLIFTMPFPHPPTWNGRPDAGGGAADGILVETSYVSILGLEFLGLPVLESPRPGIERRLYGINRSSRELEDLEIGHCMFLGDLVTNPIHVAIIANGNGIDIHHTIFREHKITIVYWQGGRKGHAMRNCVITGSHGSGLWTAGIAADFRFKITLWMTAVTLGPNRMRLRLRLFSTILTARSPIYRRVGALRPTRPPRDLDVPAQAEVVEVLAAWRRRAWSHTAGRIDSLQDRERPLRQESFSSWFGHWSDPGICSD